MKTSEFLRRADAFIGEKGFRIIWYAFTYHGFLNTSKTMRRYSRLKMVTRICR